MFIVRRVVIGLLFVGFASSVAAQGLPSSQPNILSIVRDADVLNNLTVIQAMARKDLSMGTFPDVARTRFVEVTWFRVRPGHELGFDAAAKA